MCDRDQRLVRVLRARLFRLQALPIVPFGKSMPERRIRLQVWDENDAAWLETLEARYAERADLTSVAPIALAIPHVVHHIWLGGALPAAYHAWVSSWQTKHPHWEHRLWTDADVVPFKLTNQAAFDAALNPGEKSDIWRYEILYRFGGLYVDTDFECIRCFDRVLRPFELVTGISNTGTVELNNGLVACRAKHPLMKRLISSIGAEFRRRGQLEKLALLTNGKANSSSKISSSSSSNDPMALIAMMAGLGGGTNAPAEPQKDPKQEQHEANMATITRTGPGIFTRTFMQYLTKDMRAKEKATEQAAAAPGAVAAVPAKIPAITPKPPPPFDGIAFPCSYFYPVPNNWDGSPNEGKARFVRRETLAVHHWARSWQPSDQR
jgi:hypothetical protein